MIRRAINFFVTKLSAWHEKHLNGVAFVYVVAVAIGLLCGFSAGVLKTAVDLVTRAVFSTFEMHAGNWAFFVLPVAGILIATLYTVYVIREPMDHGSDRIEAHISTGNDRLRPRLIIGPIIGCSVTLGMGGSAGAEGPIAYTGAAIGSNVGKAFNLQMEDLGMLVGCGAAAAIGGIFMAPIGGVMYALEVLKMRQSLTTVIAIVLASLTAALTCYLMLGCHTDITFVPEMRFDTRLIPWVLLCGVLCGLYSVYYRVVIWRCRVILKRVSNVWVKALLGGVVLALLLFLFPALYGEGYNVVHKLMIDNPLSVLAYSPLYKLGLDFDVMLVLMLMLLLMKPFATSATNDAGGVGGDFTPTFFAGGVAGFLFAVAVNHFFGQHLPVALFSFFGMAAVMSGAVSAPLMAIFIAAEMTGLYGFILPLTLAAVASVLTTLAFRPMLSENARVLHAVSHQAVLHPEVVDAKQAPES